MSYLPDESIDRRALFTELVSDLRKVYVLLPGGRFIKNKYTEYSVGKKVDTPDVNEQETH